MRILFFVIFLSFVCFSKVSGLSEIHEDRVISTNKFPGRTGDQLLSFIHALNFSLKFGYPLYYFPFEGSDKFMLSRLVKSTQQLAMKFDHSFRVKSIFDFPANVEGSVNYVVPYYVDGYIMHDNGHPGTSPDYRDPALMQMIRTCLQPVVPIKLFSPPPGLPSVAVHLRTGGNYDSDKQKGRIPLKFNSEESCLQMVVWLSNHLKTNNLYVHVFTDSPDPQKVLAWFNKHGPKEIQWGITDDANDPNPVLSDFFSMMNFQYLIRSRSNLSFLAQVLGNYQLILISEKAHFDNKSKKVVVDEFRSYTPEEFNQLYYSEGKVTGDGDLKWDTPY
jgi:hypothetical protein